MDQASIPKVCCLPIAPVQGLISHREGTSSRLNSPRRKSPFEQRKGALHETIEASGITPQPRLLAANQA